MVRSLGTGWTVTRKGKCGFLYYLGVHYCPCVVNIGDHGIYFLPVRFGKRFISAKNLKEILGDDFPEAEIDAMIAEATGGKHDKVSYTEFLRLWEEKNEHDRDQRIKELTDMDDETKSISSLDSSDAVHAEESRAAFLGNKISSSARSARLESLRPTTSSSNNGPGRLPFLREVQFHRQQADI